MNRCLALCLVTALFGFASVGAGKCPPLWLSFKNYCYYFSDTAWTFDEAKSVCEKRQGTLTSITSIKEREFLKTEAVRRNKKFYIGLHDSFPDNKTRTWYWVDKSPYDPKIADWSAGQPDNAGGKEHCGTLWGGGKWNDVQCTWRGNYICKRKNDIVDRCNFDDGWHPFLDEICLKFVDALANWRDARQVCKQQGADLYVIDSQEKLDLLREKITCNDAQSRVWLGLSDTATPHALKWIDGTEPTVTNWDKGQPNLSFRDKQNCVESIAQLNFKWRVSQCGQERKFICAKKQGDCMPMWKRFESSCYFVEGNPQNKLMWPEANAYCQATGGALLKIESDSEQRWVNTTLLDGLRKAKMRNTWIGASDFTKDNQITWGDRARVRYSYWNKKQPRKRPKRGDCARINLRNKDGRWEMSDCFWTMPWACKIALYQMPLVPKEPPVLYKCDKGWKVINDKCLKFVEKKMTWRDASLYCESELYGKLVTIPDADYQSFITRNLPWDGFIGIKWDNTLDEYQWINGLDMNFMNWDSTDPRKNQCIFMSRKNSRWTTTPCKNKLNFICMKVGTHINAPPTTPTPTEPWSPKCGPEWKYNPSTDACYLVVDDVTVKWNQARKLCRKLHGSDLVSVHGLNEQSFLVALLHTGSGSGTENYWIGANVRDVTKGWRWSDQSPFQYFNWAPGEPDYQVGPCVAMTTTAFGGWELHKCKWQAGYICKKPAYKNITVTTPKPTPVPPEKCTNRSTAALLSGQRNLQDQNYIATSYEKKHPPYASRLNFVGDGNIGGCWAGLYDNQYQYLEVDLTFITIITGIAIQGCSDITAWTRQFKLMYLYSDTSNWQYYENTPGAERIFTANSDQNTVVKIDFKKVFEAKRVRVWPHTWYTKPAFRFELYGCPAETCDAQSAVSGEHRVADSQMTASTNAPDSKASYARLNFKRNGVSGWVAAKGDQNPYLQIDLLGNFLVMGVRLQGRGDADMWVTYFKLSHSQDMLKFTFIQEPYGNERVFEGNVDNEVIVNRGFSSPVIARAVRFHPVSNYGGVGMRVEVMACLTGCASTQLITGSQFKISDRNLKASSSSSDTTGPQRSRLNTKKEGKLAGGWSPKVLDKQQWLQADLNMPFRIRGISTQGREDLDHWVTSYQVKFSLSGEFFYHYMEDGHIRTFEGNSDRNTVRTHFMRYSGVAHFVRIIPQTWQTYIAMRWEIYGCSGIFSAHEQGCYADDPQDRDLRYLAAQDPPGGLTIDMCIRLCYKASYAFAGAQFGKQCFCGNNFGRFGPSSQCNMKCPGNPDQTCGGRSANTIYTTGLAPSSLICRPGWEKYRQLCYKAINQALSWTGAQTRCRFLGGDLATINDKPMQDFLTSHVQLGPNKKAWIGLNALRVRYLFEWSDNQPVTFTNWMVGEPNNARDKEDCVIMYNGGMWNDDKCSKKNNFICQLPPEPLLIQPTPPSTECPKGFKPWRWACYGFFASPLPWQKSIDACKVFNGHLVRVTDGVEQAFLSSEIVKQKETLYFWTDLTDVGSPGTYHWSNGETRIPYTHWANGQPNTKKGDCVALETQQPQTGLWFDRSCKEKNGYVCETLRKGYTSPLPHVTTLSWHQCPYGWTEVNNWCFQVFNSDDGQTPLSSWAYARDHCVRMGADLASFHDSNEFHDFWRYRMVGSSSNHWIGLNSRDGNQGFKWSDGSPVNFLKWDKDEPSSAGQCVEVVSVSGYWRTKPCTWSRGWVCKVRRGVTLNITATTAPPTAGPSGSCSPDSDDWKFFNGKCYYVSSDKDDETTSWFQAENWCRSNGASLVSIHDQNEQNFLFGQAMKTKEKGLWTGLSELDVKGGWKWTDGSPTDFINWGPGEPNDHNGEENCVVLRVRDGTWNDQICSARNRFICKKTKGGKPSPTPPPQPLPGNCPAGYLAFGDKCFAIFASNNRKFMDYKAARDECKRAGQQYDLASIGNAQEQAFLTSQLLTAQGRVWIGLQKFRGQKRFLWISNEDVTYTNWAPGEPNGDKRLEDCVHMYNDPQGPGFWNDARCSRSMGYVCMTFKDVNLPPPTPAPNPCAKNGPGWFSHGKGCYKLDQSAAATWQQAEQSCVSAGGHLASVTTGYEQGFILALKSKFQGAVWIGLSDLKYPGNYMWSDGWPVLLTNWARGEPGKGDGTSGCVLMNNVGRWVRDACNRQFPYVCKKSDEKPPYIPRPEGGQCPGEAESNKPTPWIKFRGNCYLFMSYKTKLSQTDALLRCHQQKGNLLSIHGPEENQFVITHLLQVSSRKAWLGLVKSFSGGYQWRDGTPFNFNNWATGEPSDKNGTEAEDCVEMYNDGRWNDINCLNKDSVVCKAPQVGGSTQVPGTSTLGPSLPPGQSTPGPGQSTGRRTTVPNVPGGTTGQPTYPGQTTVPAIPSGPARTTYPVPKSTVGAPPPKILNASAKVGIAFVVIACLIIIALVLLVLYNRRRNATPAPLAGREQSFNNPLYSDSSMRYDSTTNTVESTT